MSKLKMQPRLMWSTARMTMLNGRCSQVQAFAEAPAVAQLGQLVKQGKVGEPVIGLLQGPRGLRGLHQFVPHSLQARHGVRPSSRLLRATPRP